MRLRTKELKPWSKYYKGWSIKRVPSHGRYMYYALTDKEHMSTRLTDVYARIEELLAREEARKEVA